MTDIQILFQLTDVLVRVDKLNAIEHLFDDIVDIIPIDAEGCDLLSYAYYKAKNYVKAVKYGELALGCASHQQTASIRYNLGKCYLRANQPNKARNAFEGASKLQPTQVDIKLDLAAALYACNRKEDSHQLLTSLLSESVSLLPQDLQAVNFNLGAHYIRNGEFQRGMQCLSVGRSLRIWGSYTHKFPIPQWNGQVDPGKRVLVVGEGGIGDEIINSRFVTHINKRGLIASFASCQHMASIFARMPYELTVNYSRLAVDIPNIESYDYWVPAMDLPTVLNVSLDDLWDGPYLTVDIAYDSKWKQLLQPSDGTIRVGVRWSGNALYEQDLHRSVDLHQLVQAIPAALKIYSIQKQDTEILKHHPEIIDLEQELESFEDALACINNMDVVVTSCTSVAHAAAALGKRVFILIPIMDYYIWSENKTTSSWYGANVTLVRQQVPERWDEAYKELGDLLREEYTKT